MSDNHEKMPIVESGQCITLFSWNGESAVIPREINGTPVIELRRINLPEAKVIEIPDSINSMSCNINLHYQVKQTVVHEKLQERIWNAESRSTSRSIRTQYDEEGNELRFIEEYSDQEKVSEAIEKIWYKRELHSVLNCCPKLREIIVDPRNSEYSSREGALYSKSGSTLISVPQDWPGETFILGESVRSVESNAFGGCRNIRRIVLLDVPLHVNDGRDFANCAARKRLSFPMRIPHWNGGMECSSSGRPKGFCLLQTAEARCMFQRGRRKLAIMPL